MIPADPAEIERVDRMKNVPLSLDEIGEFVESTPTDQKLFHLHNHIMTKTKLVSVCTGILAGAKFKTVRDLWDQRQTLESKLREGIGSLSKDEQELSIALFRRLKKNLREPGYGTEQLRYSFWFGELFIWPGSQMSMPEKLQWAMAIKFIAFRIEIIAGRVREPLQYPRLSMADSCEKGLEPCFFELIPERFVDIVSALITFETNVMDATEKINVLEVRHPILEYGTRLSENDKKNEALLWSALVTLLKRENVFKTGIFVIKLITKYSTSLINVVSQNSE